MKKIIILGLFSTLIFANNNSYSNIATMGYTHLSAYKKGHIINYNIVNLLNGKAILTKKDNIYTFTGLALKVGWNIQNYHYKIQQYEGNYGVNYKYKNFNFYALGIVNYTHTNYQPTWENEIYFNNMIGVGGGIGVAIRVLLLKKTIVDFRTDYIKYFGGGFDYSLDYQINIGTFF